MYEDQVTFLCTQNLCVRVREEMKRTTDIIYLFGLLKQTSLLINKEI